MFFGVVDYEDFIDKFNVFEVVLVFFDDVKVFYLKFIIKDLFEE